MLHAREIREHPQQEVFSLQLLMHHKRPLRGFKINFRNMIPSGESPPDLVVMGAI